MTGIWINPKSFFYFISWKAWIPHNNLPSIRRHWHCSTPVYWL